MNIIAALDDPSLFQPHFRGETWTAWRAFHKALFALPLDDAEMAIYRECTGRQTAPLRPFRQVALVCGRRTGKSRNLALIGTYLACFFDYSAHLAPGERGVIAIVSADRKQAQNIFRYIVGGMKAIGMLAGMIEEENKEVITLTNSVQIDISTASFRGTRGSTYIAVLADEIAFWRTDDSANPDVEIINALEPGLGTIPTSMMLMASSPYRKRGVLHSRHQRYFGKDDAPVFVWQAPTKKMNPGFPQAIIDAAYEEDPEKADAEYGANFRSDLADFVSRSVVDACTIKGRVELQAVRGVRYVAFCDPSGGSSDSMTLAVAHPGPKGPVLDCVREVKPPFSPQSVVSEFAATLKAYGLSKVHGDRWGGEFVQEPFRLHGIAYELSDKPKSEIYVNGLPMLNSGTAELLDVPRLAHQLCALERRTSRSGKDSIDHPPLGHDDVSNAAIGALLLANEPPPRPAYAVRTFHMMR